MAERITIRAAVPQDAALITNQRRRMFETMGGYDPAGLDKMDVAWEAWVTPRLASGEYRGWLAVVGEKVVAGAGLWMMQWTPMPTRGETLRPYVMNVYTEPDYRKRGLARLLVTQILDYCKTLDCEHVLLHASEYGRPLYETLGFKQTNEMRLKIRR